MFYAGIGARGTPAHILVIMTKFAAAVEKLGYTLRTGGAKGADQAFEAGVVDPHNKEVYLPTAGFAGNPSSLTYTQAALEMAKDFHPNWGACSEFARACHARNCHQMLGGNLDSPVSFVVCWTPGGQATGGTGQALRIAKALGIHVFNLAIADDYALLKEWYRVATEG